MLLTTLLDHKRTDGRSLPPLDWTILYDSKVDISEHKNTLLLLGVQQEAVKVI